MTALQVDDFLAWATFGVVIGGRLGYVLFYKPVDYFTHPLDIFKLWEGGMSFHGGLLGVAVAIFFYGRKYRIPVLQMGDLIAVVAPIGLFFGRLANFVNGELWGRPAGPDVPWAMIFPDPASGGIPRHPSQLYEAGLEGLLLLLLMHLLWRVEAIRMRAGTLTGCLLLGYAAARITSEFFREPDAFLGFLAFGATMGQLLSLPLALAGLILILWPRKATAHSPG